MSHRNPKHAFGETSKTMTFSKSPSACYDVGLVGGIAQLVEQLTLNQ